MAKALLEVIQGWRQEDLISTETFDRLRERTEERLGRPGGGGAVTRRTIEPAAPGRVPVQPQKPPGPGFGKLVAERQADILLYLGAFLLGVAALIFVSVGGEDVSAAVRVPVLAAYTIAGIAGGILVRRWDRVREAGHVFLGLGALLVPLNFVLFYADVLRDTDVRGDVVWLIASVFCVAFYGVLAWRGFGWLYWIPALAALLSGWLSVFSLAGIPGEWLGAWFMALAVAVVVIASPRWPGLAAAGTVLGGASLLASIMATLGDHPWQLPVTLALAAAGVAWCAYRFGVRNGVFAVLGLAAGTVAGGLWAAGAPDPTFAYPFVVSGAVSLALIPARGRWPGAPEPAAWWYAAGATLAPLVAFDAVVDTGWSGLGFLGSAALAGYPAWGNTANGFTSRMTPPGETARNTNPWERVVYAWMAFAFALAGAGLWQEQIGVSEPQTGWIFAVLAAVPPFAVALWPRFRSDEALGAAIPASAIAAFVGLPEDGDFLYAAAFLVIPGVAWLGAFARSGRWTAGVVATAFGIAATIALRAEFGWPVWALALGFGGAGLVGFFALERWREYPARGERAVCVALLSWGLHVVALLAATGSLVAFSDERLEAGQALQMLVVERGEYRVLIALVAIAAGMLAYEGWRLRRTIVLLPASAVAMVAVLLAIGLATPANVQWYTVPIGLYLLAAGLVLRRSPFFIPPHLRWHELALLAGVGFIVLPQAEQAFEPGGDAWGLVLIAEGLVFLAVGFVLQARWLVPAGVLVLSGVAIRWLLVNSDAVPYWITLGLLGTALLAVGMVFLLKAEWWAQTRGRASRWWQDDGTPGASPN